MKRLFLFLFAICLMLPAFSATALTARAAGDNTIILFEGAEQNDDTVKIDVNVRENSGVYSMLLTLDYDASALSLVNVEYGAAFQSLEPLSSKEYSTLPYKISYLGTDRENDTSTGKMMTLTFTVKENVPDGEYKVTFGYGRNKDVTYLKDGEIRTKNLIVDGARITLKGNEIERIDTVPDDGDGADDGLVGAIVAGSAAGVAAVGLTVVLIVRKKKRKWVKL